MILLPWIVLLIEGLISSLFKTLLGDNNEVMQMMIILINLVVVIIPVNKLQISRRAKLFLLFGIFLRLSLMIWDLNFRDIFVLPNSGQDTETFFYGASSGTQGGSFGRSGTYGHFLAFWFGLFGIQRGIVQYINILLFVTAVVFVVYIMEELDINDWTKEKIVIALSLLPNFMITNSILLRETLIVCLVTIGIWLFIKWVFGAPFHFVLGSIIVVSLASAIHSGAMAILLGEAVVFILYDKNTKQIKFSPRSIIAMVFVIVAFVFLFSTFGNHLFAKFQGIDSASSVVSTADKYNAGGSAYDAGFKINNSYASLIVNTPIRIIYFLASPMPWKWRGLSDIIAFCFSSTVFIYSVCRTLKELKNTVDDERKSLILIFFILGICGAAIFAWGVSNAGTAVRHREKFMTVFLLLIAICNDNRLRRQWGEDNETY